MNLRGCAAQILAKVIGDGQSLTAALEHGLPKLKDAKDRAFVQALCYGVVRHFYALDFALGKLLSKPLKAKDADIKTLLLVGLYQLQHMRVKPHAAVSETVAATSHKPWARGLVNGVLRQYLRDADSLLQAADRDQQARLNHPQWIIEALCRDWPDRHEKILHANDQAAPMFLRVNQRQTGRDAYLDQLAAQGIAGQPVDCSGTAIRLDQAVAVEQLPGFSDGQVSVQDGAAQLAAELLDAQTGDWVLDMCAAPGGKTAAILERQPALAGLVAIDVDAQRLQRVEENLARLHLQAETLVADAGQAADWAGPRRFQRILLDAPCSGFGVIRRHPDIKLLRRPEDITALLATQARILQAAWHLLTPGGILLYATCSVLKAENEQQIAAFLATHADAEELAIDAHWGLPRPHGRQILTGERQMDGFYYAKLRKSV